MTLVKEAYKQKIYTKKELESALASENIHPLSDVLRVLAFDEIQDSVSVERHIKKIPINSKLYAKFPPLALALADVFVRYGRFDDVLKMLPREEIIMKPRDVQLKSYYYRGVAKYMMSGSYSDEFMMSMNHFEQLKKIYYKGPGRQ